MSGANAGGTSPDLLAAPPFATKLLYRWLPAMRSRFDPLERLAPAEGRYSPVPIRHYKLISPIRRLVYSRRSMSEPFRMRPGGRLAVLVPYRDRPEHLSLFVPHMRDYLAARGVEHRIVVIEQEPGRPFNRAKLLNVGVDFFGADADYYALHDVDMLPVDASYERPSHPVRLCTLIRRGHGLRRLPSCCLGGVTLIERRQYVAVNGMSNNYWHWGKEDDDFMLRCWFSGITPFEDLEGRFDELPHETSKLRDPTGHSARTRKERRRLLDLIERNRRRRDVMARGVVDFTRDGLAQVEYRVRGESRGADAIRLRVEV